MSDFLTFNKEFLMVNFTFCADGWSQYIHTQREGKGMIFEKSFLISASI